MINKRFEILIVIKEKSNKKGHIHYKCLCDCGNFITVRGSSLRTGNTKSCGCFKAEIRTKHNMSKTSEYESWRGMIQRCNNINSAQYNYYGGRGIKVCSRWLDFQNFFDDMGLKPKNLTLDRIKNNLGYYKENCRWATRSEQTKNQRIRCDNKTGMRGVCWNKLEKKYHVRIISERKCYNIGYFETLKQAFKARKQAEKIYWRRNEEDKR